MNDDSPKLRSVSRTEIHQQDKVYKLSQREAESRFEKNLKNHNKYSIDDSEYLHSESIFRVLSTRDKYLKAKYQRNQWSVFLWFYICNICLYYNDNMHWSLRSVDDTQSSDEELNILVEQKSRIMFGFILLLTGFFFDY